MLAARWRTDVPFPLRVLGLERSAYYTWVRAPNSVIPTALYAFVEQ